MKKDDLFTLIDKYEIISFDIFDTLIFRNMYQPTDIFKLMEKNADINNRINDFYNLRIKAEENSRKDVENLEVNFDEIYKYLENMCNCKVSTYKKLELQLELEFSTPNSFMKKVFDYALEKGKQIYIISDMYLRKNFIKKFLEKNGYTGVPIYVSCEYRQSKGNKGLYEIVQKKNNLDKSKWLHIGDNYNSDYKNALEFGISAYHYKNIREYDNSYIPKTIEEYIICGIQNNILYNGLELGYWEKFGIKNLSQIYFGFAFWLYQLTNKKDNLYFLARDGYFVKRIYELFPKTKTDLKYLYCSRKSIQIPAFLLEDNDTLAENIINYRYTPNKKQTINDILNFTGVDVSDVKYKNILNLWGFKDCNEIVNVDSIHKLKKVVALILDDIKLAKKDELDLVKKYLKQEGCYDFDKLNVVDIGWAGSIQYSIKKILDKPVDGYYFGTINSFKKDWLTSTFGWAFDLDNELSMKNKVLDNVMMYELIFSAPHGSTIGYEEQNKRIVPILNNDDNSNIIEVFQEAALNTIKEYIKYFKYFEYISPDFCLNNYTKFINNKNYNDIVEFSKLSNDMYLGSSKKDNYVTLLDKDEVINDYEKSMKKVEHSLWKNAFLIKDLSEDEQIKLISKCEQTIERVKDVRRKIIPFKVRKQLKKLFSKSDN